jgi:ketosteroid isomerase-like protein
LTSAPPRPEVVVADAFVALAAGDLAGARRYFSPEVVYHLLNQEPRHQRVYEGSDAFFALLADVNRASDHSYTFAVHRILPVGNELVVVVAETTVTFDGRTGGGHWVIVARVIDGVIVQMTDTPETALDRFWRPPAR